MTPSTSLVSCISAEVFSKKERDTVLLASSEMADDFTEQSLQFSVWKTGGLEGMVAARGAENLGLGLQRAKQGPGTRGVHSVEVYWWWDKSVQALGLPDKLCSEALQT